MNVFSRSSTLAVTALILLASCKRDPVEEPRPSAAEETGAPTEAPQPEPTAAAERPAPPPRRLQPPNGIAQPTPPVSGSPNSGVSGPTQPAPATVQPPAPAQPRVVQGPSSTGRSSLPDPRLLLTANDVSQLAGGRIEFTRTTLPGATPGDDHDSLYYEPQKGASFGFALQVFRGRDTEAVRERYAALLASYPSAQEIVPVAGKTFFAYWGEVLFVGFIQPGKYLVVVISCGRKFCDSDALYELAKKVSARAG